MTYPLGPYADLLPSMPVLEQSRPGDFPSNVGHGYGKGQSSLPSMGTGRGSERPYNVSYPYKDPIGEEVTEEDIKDILSLTRGDPASGAFASKMAQKTASGASDWGRVRFDPSARTDKDYFASGNHPINPTTAVTESPGMPGQRRGMVPFSAKDLYGSSGFTGSPLGSGGAGHAFKTTGNFIGIGTQFGSSRAPISDLTDVDDDFELLAMNIDDIQSSDEKAIMRQRIKIFKLLNDIDSILSE